MLTPVQKESVVDTTDSTPRQSANSAMAARLLVLIAGLAAIGVAAIAMDNAGALWALILVAWGIEEIDREGEVSPLLYGAAMAAGYIVIGIICVYVESVQPLWAMILVNWFTEALVDGLSD